MTDHALLSASGAHRWIRCPGSIKASVGIERTSSVYADEGTMAHELAAEMLTASLTKDYSSVRLGQLQANAPVDMLQHVGTYVNDVLTRPGLKLIEQRVSFGEYVPAGFGTADALVLHDGVMGVHDLKYGMGERIEAEDNEQLMLYALGVVQEFNWLYDFDTFELVIHQPRLDHRPEWRVTVEDLLEWAREVATPAAREALSDNARRSPGEKQCRWCPAKATCREHAERMLAVATEGFHVEHVEFKDTAAFTLDECGRVLNYRKMFQNWFDAVEERVRDALTRGEPVEGWKFVAGRTSRAWRDDESAALALSVHLTEEALYTRKLITVAQAEKALGKKTFQTLPLEDITVTNEGAPTLAPASSKKQAIDINPTAGFDINE